MLAYGFQQAAFPLSMGFAFPHHLVAKRGMEKIGMASLNDKADHGAVSSFYHIKQQDFTA
ncbi:hypothetical protein KDH_00280 [Dictyobacter sp. S3.2.2.5]|uniref:Uncharacterized protein n=1 Tax=Dictyobacter halimunensis TaxID=3026934 RepID=A0ABQ6FGU1_9CHLR|nr:hypothetical protein KDH_00050 [Dictyobacter sp. S3.2.2.5]GLV53173.1 hypothetical protein KDH_00280 [Dictyobacter sp. S3.2.2.5]